MKSKTLFSILLLSLLPLLSSAEILIYKGAARTTISGGLSGTPTTLAQKYRVYFVCDTSTGLTTHLSYDARLGQKFHSIRDFSCNKWTVKASRNNSYTILSQIESGPDDNGKLASHSLWMKGKNNILKTSESNTFTFPRIFLLEAKGLQMVSVDGLDEHVMDQSAGAFAFVGDETAISNQAGETRAQAVLRLSAKLESLGYVYSGPPYKPVE